MFALMMVCTASSVTAQSSACDPCCWDLSYSAYADYLYWKVNRSDTYFRDNGDAKYLCPGYSSNYRLGGAIHLDCVDLGLRYTSICTSDSRDSVKFSMDFDMIDIEAGYRIAFDCIDATFRPFAGVKILWTEQKWDDGDFHDDLNGVGIYTGIDTKWELYNMETCNRNIPISLIFRGSTGILESENDYHTDEGKECLYTFVNDLFFGMNIEACDIGCFDTYMQLGYEVQNYTNWAHFFGFSGLVVRLGGSF